MRIARIWMLLLTIGIFHSGCEEKENIFGHTFFDLNGRAIHLDSLAEANKGLVLAFISPECPLCISYASEMGRLAGNFKKLDVEWMAVVSGTYYTPAEIENFSTTYGMSVPVLIDSGFVLSRHYGARITPEVHLIDREGYSRYSGAIDNWAISLGRKRLKPTAHYLADAVENHLSGSPIEPKKTEAVGCFIE
jgi:peroxiredoxin